MKPRLFALILAAALLLPGCSSILERSYVSSADHVDYSVTEDESILRAETYRGLVDAILYFVNEHVPQGVIRLYNYTTDVETDLTNACAEVVREDPLSAFVVDEITHEFSRIVSYYEVTVSFTYSHTMQEVDAIRTVIGSASVQRELQQAIAGFLPSLVLWASYFTGDEDSIRAMAAQVYYATPQAAFGMPEISITLYPDTGTRRIAEIGFQWPDDPDQLARRSEELLTLARQLLEDHPSAGEQYTPTELAALLDETVSDVDPNGSSAPDSALRGESADQLAHALALELLFQLAGLDAVLAAGTADDSGTYWLIVDTGEGLRHLLPSEEGPLLLTDSELTGLGYSWDAALYPECPDNNAELSDGQPVSGGAPEEP